MNKKIWSVAPTLLSLLQIKKVYNINQIFLLKKYQNEDFSICKYQPFGN